MDFEEHSKRFGEEEIQRWREAMKIVGNISGFVHRDFYIYISSKTLKPSIHAAVYFLIIFHKTWSQLSNIENKDVFLIE
ncbi:hypothetical protein YC2023_096621 [Brassica napus]